MTTLARVRVAWTGNPVTGAGVSTFYTAGAGSVLANALKTYFTAIKSSFPSGLVWTVDQAGETIDDNTGSLVGAWSGGPLGSVVASGVPEHAQGVGCRAVWLTDGFTNGRRVRGSTYLVPLCVNQYDPDGTILNAAVTAFDTAAGALLSTSGNDMVVLSRIGGGSSGTSHPIVSHALPDRVSWLRSRRT